MAESDGMRRAAVVVSGRFRAFGWFLLGAPAMLAALLVSGVSGYEALHLGLVADAAAVSEYHFGAESMVRTGGWRYASRATYVSSSTMEALAATALLVLLLGSAARRRHWWLIAGNIGVILLIAGLYCPGAWGS